MKACISAVGSELLTPFRVDTNSLLITERLNAIGYDVRLKAVVGDDVDELAERAARRARLGRSDRLSPAGSARPKTTSRATRWRACSTCRSKSTRRSPIGYDIARVALDDAGKSAAQDRKGVLKAHVRNRLGRGVAQPHCRYVARLYVGGGVVFQKKIVEDRME